MLLNTKKRIFYTLVQIILTYIFDKTYTLKKTLLSTEIDLWRRAARASKILKVRNEVI